MLFCRRRSWSLDSLLLVAVVLSVKVVRTEEDIKNPLEQIELENYEFDLLKDIYRRNLLQDYTESVNIRRDELEAIITDRVQSFIYDRQQLLTEKRSGIRRRRGVKDAQSDAIIEADIAAARHLYLKGFRERGYVPVNFPIDICLLRVKQSIFAAALHQSESSSRATNATTVSFFRRVKGKFEKFHEHHTVTARYFDCVSIAQLGFVAVVNYHLEELSVFDEASPIFQIQEDGTIEIVQTFGQPNQHTVHLWVHGKHVYLTHTYVNLDESRQNVWPVYRWSGHYFDVVDHLPCYNAVQIEPFSIEQQMFIAVARQMVSDGKTEDSFSDIFVLNPESQKLNLHQKIYTYSVSDMAYFFIEEREQREHFLITGNSRVSIGDVDRVDEGQTSPDSDQTSIVYKYVEGYFVPFQNMELTGVKMLLPVVHETGEFLLLVLCHDQPLLIYEYDGWKLVPSRIDFTGEAFAAGVAYMRVYRHIVNASVIVIANNNLFGKSVNLFTPQYGVENDLRQVYAHFIEWCERMHEHTSVVDLEVLYNRLEGLPDNAIDGTRWIGKQIELQDSKVITVKAKSVKTKHLLVDVALLSYVTEVNEYVQRVTEKIDLVEQTIQESVLTNDTIHWNGDLDVSELIALSGQMNQIDVKVLNNGAHRTRQTDGLGEHLSDDSIVVDRLIVDRFVDVRFWNGHAAESLLLIDDAPSKWKDFSVAAKKVVVGGNLYVNKLIDGIFFHAGNVLLPGVDQVFTGRSLLVKDLSVNRLTSKRLNSTDAGAIYRMMDQSRTLLAKSRGAMPQTYGSDFDMIDVDSLKLTGLLNEINPRYLVENVLLDEEEHQNFSGKLVIDQITADHIAIVDWKLSGIDLRNIGRTSGKQEILQDLQFVQPIKVGSLFLRDRLNHIPVIDGTLQVLLLDSNETQSITGTKTLDHVSLLSPIELQGKIDGAALNKMNPIVTIAKDVVLDGDFTIHGNVTFNGPLWAHNILTAGGLHDLYRLATHGLRLGGAPQPNQVIKFLQPVFVEHLNAVTINELDVNDLVPQATGEVQYLTGRKTFISDLAIDGVADANEINRVDLNLLNRTIFRREGEGVEQTIEGTIHFDTIIASVTNAKNVLLEGKRLELLLRLDVLQNVTAPARFENCTIYMSNAVVAQELHADNRSLVYGYDIDYILKDSLFLEADVASLPVVTGYKSFRNLTSGQLILLDDSTMNALPVENIKHILAAGENRTIIKHGPHNFQSDITVNHLLFEGSMNGIPKELFCRAWLMRTGNQTFTVGQTFEKLMVEQLYNTRKLNGGVTMDQLLENVFRTDREETIEQAIFRGGIVSYEPSTVAGFVSGLNLSADVLLKQSPGVQTLGVAQVSQVLEAKGELHILNHLNGIHFPKMMEFFAESEAKDRSDSAPANIEVHGNVFFEHDPTVIHLNGYNIQKLYGEVWLPHRSTVLTGKYHFESVEFRSSLHNNGQPINHLDWNKVDMRCLSGRRPQNISAPLRFEGDITINAEALFKTITLGGMLKRSKTSPGIAVKEYDKYALRYHENQEITGNWMFHRLEISGDLNIKTVNGYDIEIDLLRTDVPANNFTATKRFRELHVESIICPPPCVIQDVDMDEWFTNGLELKGNHTIEGILHIENAIITSNVNVLGPVNGVRFNVDHLMLKSIPQSTNTTLTLITKFPKENKIFPMIFESLNVNKINGKNVSKFLNNAARKDSHPLTLNIPVSFAYPIEAEETIFEGDMLFGVNVTHLIKSTSYHTSVNELASQVRSLNSVNEKLVENVFENSPVFSHFDKLKPLPVNAVRMLVLTLSLLPIPVEVVAVQIAESGTPSAINFYGWNSDEARFLPDKTLPSIIAREGSILNMKRLNLGQKQHLFVQFIEHSSNYFIQHILDLHVQPTGVHTLEPVYVMNSTRARDVIWMKLVKLDCIVMFSKGLIGFEVRCLREHNLMEILDVRQLEETVAPFQMVALENHLFILDKNECIQIWRTTASFFLKHHQTIAVSHPSYISVARYENQLMLAINSEHTPNTAHHGSIEIWRKTISTNGTFAQHQIILTKLPKQLQFSVLPSNELLLYTLTENWLHPLVVYRYEGVTGFREVLTSNTIRQKAKRLSMLKFRLMRKEVVAIVGAESTDFVEVVFV